MKKNLAIICAVLLVTPLMAQRYEFTKAKKLGEEINSAAEDINPRVTEDGQTLYYTRAFSKKNQGGIYSGQDIWFSTKDGSSWSNGKNLKALNNADNNALIGLNEEATKLYLINNYTAHPRRVQGVVYTSKNAKGKWDDVQELPVQVEVQNDHYGFFLSPDEQVLVISMMAEGSEGEEDLFVSFNEGETWSAPKHLGSVINSSGYEISPFLSADKKQLFFSSTGFGGEGDADIFMSTRLDDSWTNWSEPVNLGKNINSSAFDAYFVMTESGEVYFSSSRGLAGMSDIYQSTCTKVVETVEDKPVIADEEEEEDEPEEKPVDEPKVLPVPADLIVYFNFESAELTADASNKLRGVVNTLKAREDLVVELRGHTDKRGTENYNDGLSSQRAQAVLKYLTGNQLNKDRFKIYSFGEKQLTSEGNSSEAHRKNRRVEVVYKRSN